MTSQLTQKEADALLALEKYHFSKGRYDFPGLGGRLQIPLYSSERREAFNLDISRGRIQLKKNTFQTRARQTVILARLDIAGPPHRNPDGEEITCPHIHIYREGYGDKWAYPLPPEFEAVKGGCPIDIMDVFMDYCLIVDKPIINRGLFA